jgi:gamma-glutamyltranspeptidase/glutathione hydrolase
MVASSQVTAVDAGLEILRQGGNAIDAAVATAACLSVVEPCSNGLGGDAFALIWDGQRLHGLNASGRSPEGWAPERFAHLDAMPTYGWDSVTVPGQIRGWKAALERFGHLSMSDCLAPAITAAEEGFTVTPITAAAWAGGLEKHLHHSAFRETFGTGSGPKGAPRSGDSHRLPDHARTLRRLAQSNGDDFYVGELARHLCRAAHEGGSPLNADDLSSFEVEWVEPLALKACGVTGHEIPPNGQGIAALAACGVAEYLDLDRYAPEDPVAIHLLIESMKQAFADLRTEVADSKFMGITPEDLLAPHRLKARAARIDPHQAGPMSSPLPPRT